MGAITLNSGSGGTGSFCVNQNTGSNLAINILAGQAYITATPSSQNSQVLRARASSDYTAYTINTNTSGSTKYDWIYLQVDSTKANNPASDASDVTSIYTSRSSSNTTDNGTPPTYGLLLAIVTVANGATAITNSNITDKRFNTSIGAQNGSLIVTQSGTGTDAIVQAAGTDTNVNIDITAKGSTGNVNLKPGTSGEVQVNGVGMTGTPSSWSPTVVGFASTTRANYYYKQVGKIIHFWVSVSGTSNSTSFTITLPVNANTAINTYEGVIGIAFDNGSPLSAGPRWEIVPGTDAAKMTLYSAASGAGWTASGTKAANFYGTYFI